MTGALLILACVAAWLALNMTIGFALTGDVLEAFAGTLFVTFGLGLVAAFVALVMTTAGHFA